MNVLYRLRIPLVFFSLIILVSCSPYRIVSLNSFREYEISSDEMADLSFVLKKNKLHYADTDRRYIINNHDAIDEEAYETHQIHVVDNIVIPLGARGACIRSDSKHFIIDFGEGIQVPFTVTSEKNIPNKEMLVGERVFKLATGREKARLYFDTGDLRRKKNTPGIHKNPGSI